MVDVIGRAKVIVTSDVDQRSIDATGSKIGAGLKQGALIGGAALVSLGAAGLKAFQAFEVAEAQSRKLNQVLDNMGESAAGENVEKLADQLMRVTAVDDEVIKGSQTILASFSEVAASAGEVGGTFERATRVSLDLAAVMGGDVSGASRQLGKALQDPVKGITALGRAGVTFTEEQKALIEGFVEANNVIAAQDLILKEVEKQVGGTAEAAATESAKIKTAFGELEESTGQLVAALIGGGDGDGRGGGLSGAIYSVSDAVSATAKSESWGALGEDVQNTSSDIGGMTRSLFNLDKKIGVTVLKIPGLGKALSGLAAPAFGFIGVIGKVIDALQDLDKELEGNSGTVLRGGKNTSFGDSDFIGDITGSAVGGRIGPGLRLVGENGPEIVRSGSGGAYVHNNSETRRMLDGSGGDTINNNYIFNGPSSLSEARRLGDWDRQYGTRFGAATSAVAL